MQIENLKELLKHPRCGYDSIRLIAAFESMADQLIRKDIKSIKIRWSIKNNDQDVFPNIDIEFKS